MSETNKFLSSVLGLRATEALGRATSEQPLLRAALAPWVTVAWLRKAAEAGWNEALPGVEDSHLLLAKDEKVGYNGVLTISGSSVAFSNGQLEDIAKNFTITLDPSEAHAQELLKAESVSDSVLERFKKSIDTLVNAQWLRKSPLEYPTNDAKKFATNRFVSGTNYYDKFNHEGTEHVNDDYALHLYKYKGSGDPTYSYVITDTRGGKHTGAARIQGYVKNKAFVVSLIGVHPEHQRNGLATFLYKFAAKRHGRVLSDDLVSPGATKVYQSIANEKDPNFVVKLGNTSGDTRHSIEYRGKKVAKTKAKPQAQQEIQKFDLPGQTAAPRGPVAPGKPKVEPVQGIKPNKEKKPQSTLNNVWGNMQGPKPGQPPFQKSLKIPAIKLSKAEMAATCLTCGGVEFQNNEFVGCACFKELAKSGDWGLTPTKDGQFRFKVNNWEPDEVLAILGVVKRRNNGR